MLTFKTYKKRMQHPQAKLIPEYMWNSNNLFNKSLDERMLPLMSASSEELPHLLPFSPKETFTEKKITWLVVALSHPDLNWASLRNIATWFGFSETLLFHLLVFMGNKIHLEMFLAELENSKIQDIIAADEFYAYQLAAENGHLKILEYLEEKAPEQIQAMIIANEFNAYRLAAEKGHLNILKHLEKGTSQQIQVRISAYQFNAYQLAAKNGHLNVLKHLEKRASRQIQIRMAADKYNVYQRAAGSGYLEILKHLEKGASRQIQAMIAANEFNAYRLAAEKGHLKILKHLEKAAPEQVQAMIAADDFSAYALAAKQGYLKILKHLEEAAPDQIEAMIAADDFAAYALAAGQGHLKVIKHLEEAAPEQIQAMIAADDFNAYILAARQGYVAVAARMLFQSSACFAYAESHLREYRHITTPFIRKMLTILRRATNNMSAQEVFDITNSEKAKIYFYIIRRFIRLNDRSRDDDLHFLLSIPAVKALAHQAVTPGEANELLRLALNNNNHEAAAILLTIPAVRELAARNNYYQAEIHGRINLAQLARNRESSMTALTAGEQQRLEKAIAHYQPMLNSEEAVAKLMNGLRTQLRERYEKTPAVIENKKGEKIVLPMDFAGLRHLHLKPTEYEKALQAYYQHKEHTAWRYLAKPNPWMNPRARYVNPPAPYLDEDAIRTEDRWSTFDEYESLITMFWLAASDEAMPAIDGHTVAGRLDHFIDELAHIGRAHNWDTVRINSQGQEEEYDDLSGDRPSCFSGVKRRLFQSVLGHPLITLLTEDILLEDIKTFARDYFISQLNEYNIMPLKEAFDDRFANLNDMSEDSKSCLAFFNIPDGKLQEFNERLMQKYGAQYTEYLRFRKFVADKLALKPDSKELSDHYHALLLNGLTNIYTRILQTLTPRISQQGFFQEKSNATHRSGDGAAPSFI